MIDKYFINTNIIDFNKINTIINKIDIILNIIDFNKINTIINKSNIIATKIYIILNKIDVITPEVLNLINDTHKTIQKYNKIGDIILDNIETIIFILPISFIIIIVVQLIICTKICYIYKKIETKSEIKTINIK